MFKDSIYKRYMPAIIPVQAINEDAWWFLFDSGKLYVQSDGMNVKIPYFSISKLIPNEIVRTQYLGLLDGKACYCGEISAAHASLLESDYFDLRSLFGILEDDLFLLAGRAYQILNWDHHHQYCGRCATSMIQKEDERAKFCPKCNLIVYPGISPAVITAIIKGNEILLAHATHFAGNMYSAIAGFVEPGETLEETVKREVYEEVGLRIKNIKYFGNQPWPFPNSLMIAFTSEYESGEISVDGNEISQAGWYTVHNLPQIPGRISIARQLIDWFIDNHSS